MRIIILFSLILITYLPLTAQDSRKELSGRVFEIDEQGNLQGLEFVNVYHPESKEGVITGKGGKFWLNVPSSSESYTLVFSYIGYKSDTLIIGKDTKNISLTLEKAIDLEEVRIVKRRNGDFTSKITTLPTQVTTAAGLQKLACCNIGESFENSVTVDVGYSDAVSGARKIIMLGLDGKYSQFLYENIPSLRGLESGFGLSHIPGPFMESIQVSKGTSSVLNGYESTTGQINVEYKKPDKGDRLFINLFANTEGRYESNFTTAQKINDRLSTILLFHASSNTGKLDHNEDGFYDIPLSRQLNFQNRWKYSTRENMHFQFGVELLDETREGGQTGISEGNSEKYSINVNLQKLRLYSKLGFASASKPYESIGWINSFTYFDQESSFGSRIYNGQQNSFYSNLIWQTIIGTTRHQISSGLSFQYDNFREYFIDEQYNRSETVPGVFSQYTYSLPEKLTFMTGLRLDYNSKFGVIFTPRIHLKHDLTKSLIARGTFGRAFRSANVFSENMSFLASSRRFIFNTDFRIEQSWNAGINLTQHLHFQDHREGSFSIDLYRTEFIDQVITDMDHNVNEVHLFNLKGKSYSTNFQAEFAAEILKRLELTIAYRFNDVRADMLDGLAEIPFVIKHKGLFSTTYSTRFEKWKVDLNIQMNGSSRLPDTSGSLPEYQRSERSSSFIIAHTQITRKFKWFDIYSGIENLTGYTQNNPIVSAENPFSESFDASMIYAPLSGRMYYAGLRFTIK